MLKSAESKHPRIISGTEISFEVFQPGNLCDHNTSTSETSQSQTDRQTTCHGNTAL